ncbi:MAG: hypothetical protein QXX87_02135 [Candidatus Jordarchaeales archaeon]
MPEEIVVRCLVKGEACSAVRVSSESGEVTIDPRVCLRCELLRGERLTLPIFAIQPLRPLASTRLLPEIQPARPPLSITKSRP